MKPHKLEAACQGLDVLATEVFSNMLRTSGHLAHQHSQLLKGFGISRTQYDALQILHQSETDGTPILEIANRMITRVPDITRLVDRLEQDGLVQRNHSKRDRRVVLVRLQKKAERLLEEIESPLRHLTEDQIGHLSTGDLESLNQLLVRARTPVQAHA